MSERYIAPCHRVVIKLKTMGILEKNGAMSTDSRRNSSYIDAMDLDAIVQSIDDEIDKLQRVRSLLTAPWKRGFPPSE
jgi:hypothetical protein